ncbi:phosphate/phosphite/phosphonate ABC transporter substrate-binding protein [Marinicellulosiphila megalodicopiae]|uniref:phosphate/phosphite/phosphonate ABC transporter substrate-binding protein n=1 Tax=Marinicellulosiphila megalodicopiae TaxID=2724896 RepID=UPI003BB0AF04
MTKLRFVIGFFIFTFHYNVSFADTYTFGIVPQQSATKLAQLWSPLLSILSEQTGDTFLFSTAKDIPTFEKRLANSEYDFAYMNPYHFTVFNENPGYQALLKQKNKGIQGIIVVSKDSELNDIEQLKQFEHINIAFPSPAAFAASIILQAKLKQIGVNYQPVYVSSHDSVYLNIAQHHFIAGGGIVRTLKNTRSETFQQLKILWSSPKYTPHAFAAHPNVPQSTMLLFQQIMLDMQSSEKGKKALMSINIPELEIATNADWNDVRALNIDLLQHLVSP